MQVRVATEASCGAPEFTRGICPWLHNDPSTTTVPQKTTTVALSAAGNYIYWATNTGSTDETVTYEVYLTAP